MEMFSAAKLVQRLHEVLRHQDYLAVADDRASSLSVPGDFFERDKGVLGSELPFIIVNLDRITGRFRVEVILQRSIQVESSGFFVDGDGVAPGVGEGVKCGVIVEVDGDEGAMDIWACDWQNFEQSDARWSR